MFKKTFEAVNAVFSSMGEEMDDAFRECEGNSGVTFTNNNGHIVVTGRIRSIRVNDQVIELTEAGHRDRRDIRS